MGDLAAGTMVIKEKNYRKIHVSLDEFDYLTKDYRPTYPQASDLSLEQINVITRTLQSGKKAVHAALPPLRKNVQELLSITPHDSTRKTFFRPFSGITSIMPWKKFNTNFQQNQRSVKSYAYLRFKLHLFGFSFVNQPEGLN